MVELILEKGLDSATVSEIAERADVGRSTFYAHYADKEDLLQGSVEALRAELQVQIEAAQQKDMDPGVHPALAFSLPMFEHAWDHRSLFEAMVGRRSGYLFLELAQDVWADLIRSSWEGADEIAVQSIAGAFRATMSWWLATAPELGAQEVNQRFLALIEPALRQRR
jgi:AcrR family transcriptional regulator